MSQLAGNRYTHENAQQRTTAIHLNIFVYMRTTTVRPSARVYHAKHCSKCSQHHKACVPDATQASLCADTTATCDKTSTSTKRSPCSAAHDSTWPAETARNTISPALTW